MNDINDAVNWLLISYDLCTFTGACEGTLTCSTCHVILKKEDYDKLPEKPTDEELDMLDLAYELTDTLVLDFLFLKLKNKMLKF